MHGYEWSFTDFFALVYSPKRRQSLDFDAQKGNPFWYFYYGKKLEIETLVF